MFFDFLQHTSSVLENVIVPESYYSEVLGSQPGRSYSVCFLLVCMMSAIEFDN